MLPLSSEGREAAPMLEAITKSALSRQRTVFVMRRRVTRTVVLISSRSGPKLQFHFQLKRKSTDSAPNTGTASTKIPTISQFT
jgi:hypothetical protein